MKPEALTLVLVNLAAIMERADETVPPAACLAMHHNRDHVISLGAFLFAAATFLVAISTTFHQRFEWGWPAIVIPALESIVADSTHDSNHGDTRLEICIPSGLDNKRRSRSFSSQVKDMINEAKSAMRIPTFQIIVAQGVLGAFPWSALSFAPMWLELIGFSHETTATIMTLFMISTSSAILMAAVLLLALPDDPSTAVNMAWFFSSWHCSCPGTVQQPTRLYMAIGIPMVLCCSIYSFLYCTYPRDWQRARMQALIEAKMQELEKDNTPSNSKESEIRVTDAEYMNNNGRGELCSIDFDNNEEKSLLNHQI
ncbi:hypothetical protein F3Y22_tig00110569pilonHSYRG00302 [Hibiscus syriacus]|uniref:Uncharacterized protein n=1 Tax=Hibiscus syriacus TaxID=106335 RepID=A0A6A3A6M5_HIBSY|nr:hypothetical protein F3Y22_tig00110569pilonHSYRG00302 [Hibiscus syriacus]